MTLRWWSTKVRVLCLVEGSEPTDACLQDEQVFVFRAEDRESAFARALALGREQETEYLNSDEQVVMWRLARVLTLHEILADNLDGSEVHSTMSWSEDGNPAFETLFVPELQEPEGGILP